MVCGLLLLHRVHNQKRKCLSDGLSLRSYLAPALATYSPRSLLLSPAVSAAVAVPSPLYSGPPDLCSVAWIV
jgi:hypothetical protein